MRKLLCYKLSCQLEEKKTDGSESQQVEEEEAVAGVQAVILSHGARVANLAAARARGGIYTARPWQGRDSETESENEDIIESLQVRHWRSRTC